MAGAVTLSRCLVVLIALLLYSCQNRSTTTKQFDPAQVAFSAIHDPLYEGQLYPSLLLATSHTQQNSQFTVTLNAPTDDAVLRIVIDSSSLNYITIFQETLPKRGEQYTFSPSIKWKYPVLRHLRTPGALDLTFSCYINDELVDIKNLHLAYRTVNECPLSILYNNQHHDFRWLFAAYVNEDHPHIEQILTSILEQNIITRFSGYQSNEKSVREQVFAIWYYALNRGISYSSISCTSNPSPRANVQHIRFFDEVYTSRQANCIDACVFFASIMRKIGLKPVIFVEPCHAYLGYYTDRNRKKIELLETTITSWVNFPDLEKNLDDQGVLPEAQFKKVSKYLSEDDIAKYQNGNMTFEELKIIVARSLFEKATEYDRETYEANRASFADTTVMGFQQLDIEQLRSAVQPI